MRISTAAIIILFAGSALALPVLAFIDTQTNFADSSYLNDWTISGITGNCTVSIVSGTLFSNGTSNTTNCQLNDRLTATHKIINGTMNFSINISQTNRNVYVSVDVSPTLVFLRFNGAGTLQYLNRTGSFLNVGAYSANTWENVSLNFSATTGNVNITYNGVTTVADHSGTPGNISTFQTNMDNTNLTMWYLKNITIFDNDLPTPQTTIRKFPYPFRSGFTISSDIDFYDPQVFYAEMDYLNTNQTIYDRGVLIGSGVGLDIAHNFWMESTGTTLFSTPSFSFYDGTYNETQNTTNAPVMMEYMKSGHMDTIHNWGDDPLNFSNYSQGRTWLKDTISLLQANGVNITTEINHGSALVHGDFLGAINDNGHQGDNPSNLSWYHANDTIGNYSIKYIWDDQNTTNNSYTATAIRPFNLKDSRPIFQFQRNTVSTASTPKNDNFDGQINKDDMNKTIRRNGFNIIYVHLGYTGTNSQPQIPLFNATARANLRYIADNFYGINGSSQNIYVTTLSKLLKYNEVYLYLNYTYNSTTNIFNITNVNSPLGAFTPTVADLQGITLYTINPATAKVFIGVTEVTSSTVQNVADETGQTSIMFPITRPTYPFTPNRIYFGGMVNNVSADHVSYDRRPLSTNITNMTITPSSDSVNVTISIYNTTGDYRKVWNESSANHSVTTQHTIGDFPVNTNIRITVNGVLYTTQLSNSTGFITFIYTGGYSDNIFQADPITPLSKVIITADTSGIVGNSITTTDTVANASWGASTMTGGGGDFAASNSGATTGSSIWASVGGLLTVTIIIALVVITIALLLKIRDNPAAVNLSIILIAAIVIFAIILLVTLIPGIGSISEQSLPVGQNIAASGVLTFTGPVNNGETVTISTFTLQFNSTGPLSPSAIPVNVVNQSDGTINQNVAVTNLTAAINSNASLAALVTASSQ